MTFSYRPNALHLFIDPAPSYRVEPGAKGVHYYPPGVHRIGTLELKDDETVYLDEGAVVYGCIQSPNGSTVVFTRPWRPPEGGWGAPRAMGTPNVRPQRISTG